MSHLIKIYAVCKFSYFSSLVVKESDRPDCDVGQQHGPKSDCCGVPISLDHMVHKYGTDLEDGTDLVPMADSKDSNIGTSWPTSVYLNE